MRTGPATSDRSLRFLSAAEARCLRRSALRYCADASAEPLMHRRQFLRDGAATLAVAPFIDRFLFQNGATASAMPSIGPEQPFDHAPLKGIARARAATAY